MKASNVTPLRLKPFGIYNEHSKGDLNSWYLEYDDIIVIFDTPITLKNILSDKNNLKSIFKKKIARVVLAITSITEANIGGLMYCIDTVAKMHKDLYIVAPTAFKARLTNYFKVFMDDAKSVNMFVRQYVYFEDKIDFDANPCNLVISSRFVSDNACLYAIAENYPIDNDDDSAGGLYMHIIYCPAFAYFIDGAVHTTIKFNEEVGHKTMAYVDMSVNDVEGHCPMKEYTDNIPKEKRYMFTPMYLKVPSDNNKIIQRGFTSPLD